MEVDVLPWVQHKLSRQTNSNISLYGLRWFFIVPRYRSCRMRTSKSRQMGGDAYLLLLSKKLRPAMSPNDKADICEYSLRT